MPENTSNVLSIPIKTIQSKFRGLCWQARGRRVGPAGNVTGLEFAEVEFFASDAEVFETGYGPMTQAARTNLSRNAGGMGRPVSNNASRWTLAALGNRVDRKSVLLARGHNL